MKIKHALSGLLSGLLLLAAGTAASHAVTIRFQEGVEITVDGVGTGVIYTHTQDTYTDGGLNNGTNGGVWVWAATTGMLRFEDIFGPGAGQIPVGSTVQDARLSLAYVGFGNGTMSFGRLDPSQTWTEASNYFTFSDGNGLQYGTDATFLGIVALAPSTNDVTSSLSIWASNPALNNGWAFTASVLTGFRSSEGGPGPVLTVTFTAPPAPPTVNAGIALTRTGIALNRATNLWVQTDTLTNTTASAIAGPLYLALDSLSPTATLTNGTGVTANVAPLGSPYVQVLGAGGSLAPGASVSTILLFSNPTRAGILYTGRILSGGAVAP